MELDVEFKRDVSFKGAHSLGVGIWGLRGREGWSWGRSSGGGEELEGPGRPAGSAEISRAELAPPPRPGLKPSPG